MRKRDLAWTAVGVALLLLAVPLARNVVGLRGAARAGRSRQEDALGDWTSYANGLSGTHASLDSGINATDAPTLVERWVAALPGAVQGSPIVSQGVVYAGDMGRHVDALDARTGALLWSAPLPANVSATMAAWQDEVLAVTLSPAVLHALDAATGAERWNASVAPGAAGWGSPIVVDGVVVIGASGGDDGLSPMTQRGSVQAFDARNGTLLWRTFVVPEGKAGGAVWTTPVVVGGLVVVGTGNGLDGVASDAHTDSILALSLATGDIVWSQHYPDLDDARWDDDFGSSPILFPWQGSLAIGEAQKSGDFRVVNATTGAPLWDALMPGQEVIGSPALMDGVIVLPRFVGDDDATALVAATGQVAWSVPLGATYSSLAAAPGVFFALNMTGSLLALASGDGATLARWQLPGGSFSSPVLAEGALFAGYQTNDGGGGIVAYALPG